MSRLQHTERAFPFYRQVRGDGNCFYRAFIYAYLELVIVKGRLALAAFIEEYLISSYLISSPIP